MVLTILLFTALASLINLWFYVVPSARLVKHFRKKPPHATASGSLDILLAARNEAENLKQFLPTILDQDLQELGVLVVNDNSTDGTARVLAQFEKEYPQLRVVSAFAKTSPGKKAALSEAIATSTSKWILATDADCKPSSSNWATKMLRVADKETELVLGYGPYQKSAGWLNRWIRFEALYTAAQYLSAAAAGRPYMGVGRNMLYSRALYERVGGFSSHAHLAGGDDDLLVNQGATPTNTKICTTPDAWVHSVPHRTWSGYFRQKSRHLSVSTTYKKTDQVWLGMLAVSHVAHFVGFIVLLLLGVWQFALLIYCVRLAVVWWRMRQIASSLGEGDLTTYLPALDAGVCIYYVRFSLAALFPSSGKANW